MFDSSVESGNSFSSLIYQPHNNAPFGDPVNPFAVSNHNSGASIDYGLRELDLSSPTDPNLIPKVQQAGDLVRNYLTNFAQSGNYDELTGITFGDNYNQEVVTSLKQDFSQENLGNLPDVKIIDSDILNGANGAYAAEIDTIFLSDDFVHSSSIQEITGVLLEEIGHGIDNKINNIDAAGDEGDIFSRLVRGESIYSVDLALLKQEDDSASILFNGQVVSVEQDNTLSVAYNMGTLSGSRSFSGWVGSTDTNDYYRFYVGSTSNFRLNLSGLSANANVQLLNSSGTVIQSSTLTGTSSELITRQLSAGTYYARVLPYSGANTNYNLSLNATATPLDNTLSTARNLGTLNGNRSFSDWIGSTDTNDYYRFSMQTQGNVQLTLNGLSGNANLQLIKDVNNNGIIDSGDILQGSYNTGKTTDTISRSLSAGTYLAKVYSLSGVNTNYNLSLKADTAGNSFSTARDLGTFSGPRTFSDWIGNSDLDDWYKFYVNTTETNYILNLTGLTPNNLVDNNALNVEIFDAFGNLQRSHPFSPSISIVPYGWSSWLYNSSGDNNTTTYYIRVSSAYSHLGLNVNTNYNLSLNLDYAENSYYIGRDIGMLSGSRTFSDWIGGLFGNADPNDYYEFELDSTYNFSLNLTGLTANADVQLLDNSSNVLASSNLSGSSSESINRELTKGKYHIRVLSSGSANTHYNLSVNANPLDDDSGNTLSTARNLGTLIGSYTYSDWVGKIDTDDYYRFSVDTESDFHLNLGQSNIKVYLLDSNGIQIKESGFGYIDRSLNKGTYYIKVRPDIYTYSVVDTHYKLSLNATPVDNAGNSTSSPLNIGTLGTTNSSYSDWVGSLDSNDYYSFSLNGNRNLRLNLTGLSGNADVQILNSSGSVIGSSNNSGTTSETINLNNLVAGTYYARVYSPTGVNTNYNLSLKAEIPDYVQTTTSKDGQQSKVTFERVQSPGYIENKPTWLVIHGWNGQAGDFRELAGAIEEYDGIWGGGDYQVLTVDWSAARGVFLDTAASWIDSVAESIKNTILSWGISAYNINLVGHSLGSYVAYEVSERLGGINKLVALNPASTTFGGYDTNQVNFSRYSDWSWAFWHNNNVFTDNPDITRTANESFQLELPFANPDEGHGGSKILWTNMLRNKYGSVSQYFGLEDINGSNKPWYIDSENLYSPTGWEAQIVATDNRDGYGVPNWIPNFMIYL